MSNNLVLRARGGGLERNMDSLIDHLRQRFTAASQSNSDSTPLSQAMLLQAMSHHHNNDNNSSDNNINNNHHHTNNNNIQRRPQQIGENVTSRQAQASTSATRLGHRTQAGAQVSRSLPQAAPHRAQCAPLDLSVKTTNPIRAHSNSSERSRVASSQSNSIGQRRHQHNHHQQQQQQQQQYQQLHQQQQNLSLDMLKTIAQVIIREKSGLNQPQAKLEQVQQLKQHQLDQTKLMHQTQLISSSASSVSDYNDQSPERIECNLISANTNNSPDGDQIVRQNEIEIARRLTAAAAAAAAAASTAANQTDVISSTNGRRLRRQSANTKRQKASKSHLCNHCGRSFVRSDMLTRHSRLHSGHKPYQCGKCLQVFSRSDHLSTHERTHTGEKPYQCGICAYSACRRDMITRHMRTHLGQRVKHRPSADGSTTTTEAAAGQAEGSDAGGELEPNFGLNGANSNETNSNAQSPSSIATTILMEDDDDENHDEEEGEAKQEIRSFLYNTTTTRAYN